LLLLLAPAAATTLQTDLSTDLKERPVMKVVRMLQDTKAELEKELEDDKAVHEMMDCWCKSNNQEKTAAIASGNAKIAELEASMGASAGRIAELKQKRTETLAEVNSDHKALSEATAMRMKENQEFQASETDYIEAVDAAKNAIIVLGKHNPALAQVKAVAHRLLDARVSQMVGHSRGVSKVNAAALTSFLHNAESASSFLAIPGMQSYAPQSGQIFGILGQMKEDFEANLAEAQKSEAKSLSEYQMLKAAKDDEIATGRKIIVSTDGSIAEFQEKFAQASKQLEDTQEQLGMDTEFLANLEAKCANTDADFDKRVKDRMTEIEAVTDTIKILNSDESFESFDKMEAPVFFQLSESSSQKERRSRVVSVLQRAARVSGKPQLALLAASAQLDAFTEVKVLIDKMVTELAKQQKDEVVKRDYCIEELNSNERSTKLAYEKKDQLQAKIADLTKTIQQLSTDIAANKAATAEMMNQMKRASETREGENADFQTTVNDHRVMSMILTKALDRMKQVYAMIQNRAPGAPHTQTSGTHTDPGNGPAKFKKMEKNAGGGRVVSMLEEILADTRKVEDQAVASEQDSQSAYENFMKDSNKSITKMVQTLSDMNGARASAKEELSMSKTDLGSTVSELEGLDATSGDLHKACDYVLKNFDARQSARSAEMDALKEAKNILSGMN